MHLVLTQTVVYTKCCMCYQLRHRIQDQLDVQCHHFSSICSDDNRLLHLLASRCPISAAGRIVAKQKVTCQTIDIQNTIHILFLNKLIIHYSLHTIRRALII